MGKRSMKEQLKEMIYTLHEYRRGALIFLAISLFVCLSFSVCSCTRVQYIPKESIHKDTVYQSKVKWDSIYVQDSVYIREKGDTIFVNRTKFKYIERLSRDTIYKTRVDSVVVPQAVEKQLSWYENQCLRVGRFTIGVLVFSLLIGVLYFVYRFYKR